MTFGLGVTGFNFCEFLRYYFLLEKVLLEKSFVRESFC
jgi:hypothetical protein